MASANARLVIHEAAKRCGILTWRDLAAARISRPWLDRRLETGELTQLARGIFKIGPQPPTQDEFEMAALMKAGEGAVLSHITAARRLGLAVPKARIVHLTIPGPRRVSSIPGVEVWRSRDLVPGDVTQRGPFRLTNLARTMIDLAAVLEDGWLRAALDSALRQRSSYLHWLYRTIRERGVGHRGVARLRALLDQYQRGSEVPDSALESLAMELAVATGHQPMLHLNVVEDDRRIAEVDLAWPEVKLCVEVDGWTQHGTRSAFEDDRARDRALVAHGWAVLRYTWRQVIDDRGSIVAELAEAYKSRSLRRNARARARVAS